MLVFSVQQTVKGGIAKKKEDTHAKYDVVEVDHPVNDQVDVLEVSGVERGGILLIQQDGREDDHNIAALHHVLLRVLGIGNLMQQLHQHLQEIFVRLRKNKHCLLQLLVAFLHTTRYTEKA